VTWTAQFIASPQIRLLGNSGTILHDWRDIAKGETINAPAGATQAEVRLPEWFATDGSNRFHKNGVEIVSERNLSVHTLSESANYFITTRDGYGPNPTDTTRFELILPTPPPATYTIAVSASPGAGGQTGGGGDYAAGASCTVNATAHTGYQFKNWTESETEVSTNATYTFTVSGHRALVANFGELPPTVTTHPAGQTLVAGGDLSLSVAATGLNLSYRWEKDHAPIGGATNATYTKSNVQPADAGSYTCVVSNGGGSVTSQAAVVTVELAAVAVTGVTLNKTAATLAAGASETLVATVAPANATNPAVSWSSNAPAVAAVNAATGEVTAVAPGAATITATTHDGGFTATCVVTVAQAVIPPPIPVFDGLEEAYAAGSPAVALKVKGTGSERLTVFKVNGQPAATFAPHTAGRYTVEASSPDGKLKITRTVEVK
jgi:hypothetical protein